MEQTLVLVKPDGVRRRLIGEILRRFETRMLEIRALKIIRPSRELIEKHYEVHRGKPFFEGVVSYMSSGVVVAVVLAGDDAIAIVRKMMGATQPIEAQPGTIRGDFALSVRENLVHGSDSPESAEREIAVWFAPEEILS
ncbi:MAG TPA: nucleoside-diphosphate kinase [Armatimonadota bacterium]